MHFFSTDYRYDLPESKPVWQAAEAFIRNVPELKKLHAAALTYMQLKMQASHKRDLNPFFEDIPVGLKKAYVKAFRDPKMVGDYSRIFWLQRTGLDKYAAGAIYRVLKQERLDELELTDAEVFKRAMHQAKSMPEMNESDLRALQHISQAEPFLSLIDLMFSGLRRQSSQTLAEFRQFWQSRGLTELDLPQKAAQLLENDVLLSSLSGTPARRFQQLLALACMPSLEDQVRGLLDYHHKIMESRGQFPWLLLEGDDILLQVPPCSLREDRQNSDWVNRYYLPQFRHLLNGLWGHSA